MSRARRRPLLTAISVAGLLAVSAIVLVWFQPQALLFDTVVEEEFPGVGSGSTTESAGATGGQAAGPIATNDQETDAEETDAGMAATNEVPADERADDVSDDDAGAADAAQPSGPVAFAAGEFSSRGRYTVTGDAVVYELPDGSRTLRLEDFESTNGPDLYVHLAASDAADDDVSLTPVVTR